MWTAFGPRLLCVDVFPLRTVRCLTKVLASFIVDFIVYYSET
jgi:hypothetical protein